MMLAATLCVAANIILSGGLRADIFGSPANQHGARAFAKHMIHSAPQHHFHHRAEAIAAHNDKAAVVFVRCVQDGCSHGTFSIYEGGMEFAGVEIVLRLEQRFRELPVALHHGEHHQWNRPV